jgi:hypothetical protein
VTWWCRLLAWAKVFHHPQTGIPVGEKWALNHGKEHVSVFHSPHPPVPSSQVWGLPCTISVNRVHFWLLSSMPPKSILVEKPSVWGLTLTYPRVERDLLILAASFNRSPSAPDALCLMISRTLNQEPAKAVAQLLRLYHVQSTNRQEKSDITFLNLQDQQDLNAQNGSWSYDRSPTAITREKHYATVTQMLQTTKFAMIHYEWARWIWRATSTGKMSWCTNLAFNSTCKYTMWATALLVHIRSSHFSVGSTLKNKDEKRRVYIRNLLCFKSYWLPLWKNSEIYEGTLVAP